MPKLDVHAPWDGSVIETFDTVGKDGADRALSIAAGAGEPLPVAERTAILDRARARMREQREDLAVEAAREGGKPLRDSLVEVDRAIDGMGLCIEAIRTQAGHGIPMGINPASSGRLAFTRWEPIGPVLAFSAFNHPLNLIVHQVGPAVAAGCPVVVKPAEATPVSCFRFVEFLRDAGLPDAWCQPLLTDDHETSAMLASDPRIAFFTFIGSARVGWMLRSRLAPGTRCALEHGGAAPVVLLEDADLDDAIPLLAKGGFYHAGQVCVSVQRVFAARSIAREVAERLADAARALRVGDPTEKETDVGPLIRPAEVERVGAWVRESKGALLCGGEALSARAYAPTVLFDPDPAARVSREEIFGPVVAVYPVDDLDEGIRRSNDVPFSFQSAVFGRDVDAILAAVRRLDAATVLVNDHTAFRVDWMPFAGHRQSGLGTGGIGYTLREMQREKLVVIRSPSL